MMSNAAKRKLHEIDVLMLKNWLDNAEAYLVDVRESEEYLAEHIPGAQFMPLSEFDPQKLQTLTDRLIVLQCQSGHRSAQAAQTLFKAGFEQVTHLKGGLSTWKAAGYPTVVNKQAPMSMFRQVQISAGLFVILGCLLTVGVSHWFLLLPTLVGAGLIFAGVTNTCAMAMLLSKLPYNQRAVHKGEMVL